MIQVPRIPMMLFATGALIGICSDLAVTAIVGAPEPPRPVEGRIHATVIMTHVRDSELVGAWRFDMPMFLDACIAVNRALDGPPLAHTVWTVRCGTTWQAPRPRQ